MKTVKEVKAALDHELFTKMLENDENYQKRLKESTEKYFKEQDKRIRNAVIADYNKKKKKDEAKIQAHLLAAFATTVTITAALVGALALIVL